MKPPRRERFPFRCPVCGRPCIVLARYLPDRRSIHIATRIAARSLRHLRTHTPPTVQAQYGARRARRKARR